jgi:hypothetical protein
VLVAALAFWLSYNALTLLAVRAGIGAGQAWAWPLIVDGIIVVSTVAVVALKDRPGSGYAWVLLIAGAAVSVTANAVQAAMPPGARLSAPLAAAVSAVPPVVLLAITHLTVVLTRPRQHGPPTAVPPPGRAAAGPSDGSSPADRASADAVGPSSRDDPSRERAGRQDDVGPGGVSAVGVEGAPGDLRANTGQSGEAPSEPFPRGVLGAGPPGRPALDRESPDGAAVVGEARRTLGREDARRLKGEGLTNRAIAQMLGVNPATVGRWLRTEQTGEGP